jgi:hypothetical protein
MRQRHSANSTLVRLSRRPALPVFSRATACYRPVIVLFRDLKRPDILSERLSLRPPGRLPRRSGADAVPRRRGVCFARRAGSRKHLANAILCTMFVPIEARLLGRLVRLAPSPRFLGFGRDDCGAQAVTIRVNPRRAFSTRPSPAS